jgi:hypothetical protein
MPLAPDAIRTKEVEWKQAPDTRTSGCRDALRRWSRRATEHFAGPTREATCGRTSAQTHYSSAAPRMTMRDLARYRWHRCCLQSGASSGVFAAAKTAKSRAKCVLGACHRRRAESPGQTCSPSTPRLSQDTAVAADTSVRCPSAAYNGWHCCAPPPPTYSIQHRSETNAKAQRGQPRLRLPRVRPAVTTTSGLDRPAHKVRTSQAAVAPTTTAT